MFVQNDNRRMGNVTSSNSAFLVSASTLDYTSYVESQKWRSKRAQELDVIYGAAMGNSMPV